jgi:thiol:disulfide interchange protein
MSLPKKLLRCVVGWCALFALAASVSAQQKVNWSAKLEPAEVKPGQKAKLLITASIESGWHLYSLTQPAGGPRPTQVTIDEHPAFALDGEVRQPKPKVAFDPNFQLNTETFDSTVTFTAPIKVAADAPPGAQKLVAKVRFQVCDEHQCLPPRTKPLEVDVMIAAANAPAALAGASPAASPKASPSASPSAKPSPTASVSPSPAASVSSSPDATNAPPVAGSTDGGAAGGPTGLALPQGGATTAAAGAPAAKRGADGLFSYLWLAVGAGFLALLTPCVFPMIPITVSFFTKREHQTRGAAIKQALVYCLGIIFTFTGLGLALAPVLGATGVNRLAVNPWMNLFLTALFVVFALNLFGLFEIRLPSGLLSKLDARAQSGTVAASLLMGLTFTLTSFTCTFAFVGTALVGATQGEWFWSALGMLAFATAFASPFFLLAVFPHWLRSLPSSGGWLNSTKVVLGFLELAAAFKFLSNVDLVWEWETVSRNLVLAAWIAIAVVTAVYLLGKFQLTYDTPVKSLGVLRMLTATFFLGVAFYLLTGLLGAPLGFLDALLPPAGRPGSGVVAGGVGGATSTAAHAKWLESYDEALARAKAENKPVFINFTGVTCTNCRWMETNVIADAEVQRVLGDFVLAELYTDRDRPEDERNGQLQEQKFGTIALPLYVVVDHNGNELAQQAGLTRDKAEFIRFLQAGAGKFEQLAKK